MKTSKAEKLSMRATLPVERTYNAVNYGGEKETIQRMIVVGKKDNNLRSIVEARLYMGRSKDASNVYCSLWVHGEQGCSGKGVAGGHGYHKNSAALASAIRSAGITLKGSNYSHSDSEKIDFSKDAHIAGCGHSSMETALKAIARAVGIKGQLLIV